jgi:hypothetical protein
LAKSFPHLGRRREAEVPFPRGKRPSAFETLTEAIHAALRYAAIVQSAAAALEAAATVPASAA